MGKRNCKRTDRRLKAAGALVLAIALAGCTGTSGGSINELAGAGAAGASGSPTMPTPPAQLVQPAPTESPTESPTATPDIFTEMQSQPPAQVVEVPVEVTRIVEVIVTPPPGGGTATPDVAGFPSAAGIDESVQPCPINFWKRGRCTATAAQIAAYSSEVQP